MELQPLDVPLVRRQGVDPLQVPGDVAPPGEGAGAGAAAEGVPRRPMPLRVYPHQG